VLFGSRARGDARADSDFDVAIFLHGMEDRWAEFDRIDPIVAEPVTTSRTSPPIPSAPCSFASRSLSPWASRPEHRNSTLAPVANSAPHGPAAV
jgi:hypothetical protein